MVQIPTRQEMSDALSSRHGASLQRLLEAAHVTICGLGGLGSNIAFALARSGVGHLHLIDFDRVDITNLNRQQYFLKQIGMYKTEALKETLSQISPYMEIQTSTVRVTEESIPQLLGGAQIICEAFDQPEAKAMLVSTALEKCPDAWIVSGNGMAGMESANLIRTRLVGKRLILCGDGISDVERDGSLFASRVMVCAAHQALAVIQVITGGNCKSLIERRVDMNTLASATPLAARKCGFEPLP